MPPLRALPLALALLATAARADESPRPLDRAALRDAAARGLRIVAKAAENYPHHRTCFSCHHQTLPMLALVEARARGLDADPALVAAQAEFSRDSFRERLGPMKEGKGIGGGAMTVGYGLWALRLAGRAPDEVSDAMRTFLVKTQRPDGSWATGSRRPPLEESPLTTAFLAIEGLRDANEEETPAARVAIARARAWVLKAPIRNQEDRNFRLWTLARTEADPGAIAEARAAVLATRRDDGSWPARDDLPGDAYATGQTIARLLDAGLAADHPAIRAGLDYLLRTQCDDGSWKVETRAKPVQTFFDNGDPHGTHQFIAIPATCWAVVALLAALPAESATAPFDLLIRGGTIVDGTGNPWFKGDLAINGDTIAALGRIAPDAPARRVLVATGLVVAPGFIDMHAHSDRSLLEDGAAQSKVRQGVTTEVLGEETSGGPALGKSPPGRFERDGKTLEWTTFGGYLKTLEEGGISVNVASYVGLGTLLGCVLGDALDRPDGAQLDEVKKLLDQALGEGAFGLSTMLAGARELNVATDDLVALAQVVHRHGGLYSSHIRNEGTGVLDAVREAIAIGERGGVPVDIIHLKIADQARWGHMKEIVALIDDARRRGVNVQANVYPYTRGNNDLVTILPPWVHEGGTDALLGRLKDKGLRARIRAEIASGLPGWYDHYTAVGGDWSRMLVSASLSPANRRFQGMTMDRILAEKAKGQSPRPTRSTSCSTSSSRRAARSAPSTLITPRKT